MFAQTNVAVFAHPSVRDAVDGAPCAVAIATGGRTDAPAAIGEIGVADNETTRSTASGRSHRQLTATTAAER